MYRLIYFLASLSLIATQAAAVQKFETVIKDTQFNSSSRIVIDKAEIERSHARNLTSLLAAQANI